MVKDDFTLFKDHIRAGLMPPSKDLIMQTTLKCISEEQVTVYRTEYALVNLLVETVYNVDFNCHDVSSDAHLVFEIERRDLAVWELELLDDFLRNSICFDMVIEILLLDCCNKGHLEPGLYIIQK